MRLTSNDINILATHALSAAHCAANYIQKQLKRNHRVDYKSGVESLAIQVVTDIDIESQKIILSNLAESIKTYDLGLLTEELVDDGSRFTKDYFWCIDPLDGTLPFTEQQPGYAVSIALISQSGKPVMGTVVDPFHQSSYQVIHGKEVLINGKQVGQPKRVGLGKSLVCNVDRSFMHSTDYNLLIKGIELMSQSFDLEGIEIRSGYGAVMNALSLIGMGPGCYVKLPKKNKGGGCIWDFAATACIFEALGYKVTDAFGNPLNFNSQSAYFNESGVIYSNDEQVHNELVDLCQSVVSKR